MLKMETKNKIKPLLSALLILSFIQTAFAAGEYEKGMAYYKSKRYDKAKEMFLKIAENGNALYYLGEIENTFGRYKEAKEYFQKAVKTKSINHSNLKNAYWNIAGVEEKWGEYENFVLTCHEIWYKMHDEAARQKIDALINKMQWSNNSNAVAEYNKGMEKKLSQPNEAIAHFKEAVKIDDSFLAPRFELGIMALHDNDMNTAESYLSAVTAKMPYYAEANLALGDVYFSKKRFSPAIDCYNKSVKFGFLNSSILYHINFKKAQCYYNAGDFEQAEDSASMAAELAPAKTEPLTLLSAAYIKQKNFDKALAVLQKACELQPDNTDALYQLGSIYYSKKDERYLDNFDKLFNLTKDREKPPYPLIIPIIINGHFEKKGYARVNEIFSLLPNAQNSGMTLIKAKALYYSGQYDKAIIIFRTISLNNDDNLLLASAYARERRNDQAKAIIQPLFGNTEYREKALKDSFLSPLVKEIEREIEQKRQIETDTANKTENKIDNKIEDKIENKTEDKIENETGTKTEDEKDLD